MIGAASVDWTGIAAFLGALTVFVSTVTAAVVGVLNRAEVRTAAGHAVELKSAVAAVQASVDTVNSQTAGQLLDAAETRAVAAIPPAERTATEAAHIAEVPPVS